MGLECLFPVENIHPTDGLRLRHLPQIRLGGLQILVPEDDLGDNLQRNPVPTRIGSGIPPEIMGSQNDIESPSQILNQRSGRGVANRKDAVPRVEILLLDVVMESFGDLFGHECHFRFLP